jgi:hypothetical protein
MDDITEEYRTSLADLTQNSKPLINMLTMLAEVHCQFAFSNSETYAEIKHVLKLAFNLSVFSNLISKDQVKDVMFLVQGLSIS